MERKYTVYKHTCPNGKVYIGITGMNPVARWGKNGGNYRGQVFFDAITKYGWDNIRHEILFTNLSKAEAESTEIKLIEQHKSNRKSHGYNIDNGGNCGGSRSIETRLKISESLKRTLGTEQGKMVHSQSSIGRKHTEEWKRMMSELHSGKVVTEETRQKLSQANRGRKYTDERNQKISKTMSTPIVCVELGVEFYGMREAERQIGVPSGSISKCLKGKLNTAGGYHWRYAELTERG